MKKISILLCAATAIAALSCNKEVQEPQTPKTPEVELVPMTFTATTAETRTLLEDHVYVNWLSSDMISVFDGVDNRKFTTRNEGRTVEFTGEAASATTYYALYPYDGTASLNNGSVATTLPEFQTAVNGSFIDGLNLNAAQSNNTTFVFDNVLSVAKITIDNSLLNGKTLKAIKLSSNYALSGDVIVSFGTTCSATAGTNTVNDVVLVGGSNGILNGDYYLLLLPNQGGTIKLTFYATDNSIATKTASLTKAFSAGTIKNLGTAKGLTWQTANWKLVTDASTLRSGDKVVIASEENDAVGGAFNSKNGYLESLNAAFSSDKNTITSLPDEAAVFTLGGTSDAWTLTSASGQLYSENNVLNYSQKGAGNWTISISGNNATIQAFGTENERFLYNVNSPRFKTYSSAANASMILPQLYRLEGDDPIVIPISAVAAPTFTPAEGTYQETQNVAISTTTVDASIFYTTGDSDFSAGDWTAYSGPIAIEESCTLKALAIKGGVVSEVTSAYYQIGAIDYTATMAFGTNNIKINSASVTATDSENNTWTITTTGTSSFTQHADCSQVGSSKYPASTITFTTTLSNNALVKNMSAKFGGYSGTLGTVKLMVGDTVIGSGNLNGTNDVNVSSNSTATGTVLTITLTNIDKGVKVYDISVSYSL